MTCAQVELYSGVFSITTTSLGPLARKLTSHLLEVFPTAKSWCGEEAVTQGVLCYST
jgi:hypothetical protein